jgi:hypothetical protein
VSDVEPTGGPSIFRLIHSVSIHWVPWGTLHEMRLLLTRSENIALTIIITHLTLSLLCRLLPVRLGDSIVNLSEFYSYSLIGKLTAFLHLQEFSQCNQIWDHSYMGAFFHFRRAAFSSMLKSRVSSILAKTTPLRINLNLDDCKADCVCAILRFPRHLVSAGKCEINCDWDPDAAPDDN